MKNLLSAGALVLALLGPVYLGSLSPASAQDACRFTVESAVADITKDGTPYMVIDDPDAVKALVVLLVMAKEVVPPGVTRILLAQFNDGHKFYGVEVKGCLSPPLPLPLDMDFAGKVEPGKGPNGTGA